MDGAGRWTARIPVIIGTLDGYGSPWIRRSETFNPEVLGSNPRGVTSK